MKKRILLVWPIFQALYPRPFETFAQICIAAGRQTDYLFAVKVFERQSLVAAMNLVGDLVLARQFDAVIVFDDDCFPPVDVVPKLLQRCFDEGHPFVSAVGIMRGFPYTTTVARCYPEGVTARIGHSKPEVAGFEWIDDLPDALVEADFCGVPAAIIHRSCFERIPSPWFGDLDQRGERVTHDAYFCRKLKAAGIPVQVDGTLRCGHLTEAPIITFENRAIPRAAVPA